MQSIATYPFGGAMKVLNFFCIQDQRNKNKSIRGSRKAVVLRVLTKNEKRKAR